MDYMSANRLWPLNALFCFISLSCGLHFMFPILLVSIISPIFDIFFLSFTYSLDYLYVLSQSTSSNNQYYSSVHIGRIFFKDIVKVGSWFCSFVWASTRPATRGTPRLGLQSFKLVSVNWQDKSKVESGSGTAAQLTSEVAAHGMQERWLWSQLVLCYWRTHHQGRGGQRGSAKGSDEGRRRAH